jgi:hypothetical protein
MAFVFSVSIEMLQLLLRLRWVFGWNGLVKIVSPQEVCEDYRQMLENALRTQEL